MADVDRRVAAGRHTRRPGQAAPARPRPPAVRPPGVRRVSIAALVLLVLQYGMGMILNFYVAIPAADAHAGIFTEIATAPLALTVHALLGVALVGTAILAVARAMRTRERVLAVLAAGGLAAIVGAFVAGEMFVKNGADSLSFAMAMLTGAALLCYVAALVLSSRAQAALGQETEPLLVSVPAAREPENYEDGWGAEPGWDDDPDWAGRLRQDQDPGWPGQQGWPQNPGPALHRRPAPPPLRHQERRIDQVQRAGRDRQAGRERQAPWEQDTDWQQPAVRPEHRPDWRQRPPGPNWRL
jgi:hypothetical protein